MTVRRRLFFPTLALMSGLASAFAADAPGTGADAKSSPNVPADKSPAEQEDSPKKDRKEKKQWRSLFDGKTLKGWKKSDFYGESRVAVEDGAIVMTPNPGTIMAGVTATQKVPKLNYEVVIEAQRVKGSDFFCGLTFPVKKDYCSLIVGGWGGEIVGLSSLDGMDASENQTGIHREFESGKWYTIKLRVTGERITAWIDGEETVDVDIENIELSTRLEVEWSKPFGIATYSTTGAVRTVKIRKLSPEEVRAVNNAEVGNR